MKPADLDPHCIELFFFKSTENPVLSAHTGLKRQWLGFKMSQKMGPQLVELEIELWTPEYKASDLIIHYIRPVLKVILGWARGGLIVILTHILFVGQY